MSEIAKPIVVFVAKQICYTILGLTATVLAVSHPKITKAIFVGSVMTAIIHGVITSQT